MIEFIKDGEEVLVKVNTSSSINWHIKAKFNCNSELYAALLRQELHSHLNNTLERIRKQAYEQGWKDAKARTKKETWFSGWW